MKNNSTKHTCSIKTHPHSTESVAALASVMADNFNNILTTVLGACTLIDRDDATSKELSLYVSLIRVSAERAAALSIKLKIASAPVQDSRYSEIPLKISEPGATSVRDK